MEQIGDAEIYCDVASLGHLTRADLASLGSPQHPLAQKGRCPHRHVLFQQPFPVISVPVHALIAWALAILRL